MRVLVAGATGVIGRQLTPMLVSAGYEVSAMSQSGQDAEAVATMGAQLVVADALNQSAVTRAISDAAPDAVVNMLTAIPAELNPKRLAKDFELTNQLRTVGTRHLYAAAEAVGVSRVVAQGLAYAYDPAGQGPAGEDEPLWREPPAQFVPVLEALRELERQTTQADGLVLRLGHLYGPGTIYSPEGSFVRQVQHGKVPLVGGGTAVFSFIHTHDVARAVVAALGSEVRGVLNVVDDDPAQMREWLPVLAHLLGARPPKKAPALLARMAVGNWGVAFMSRLRGAANDRARSLLGWQPSFSSWRSGFAAELGRADRTPSEP